MPTRIAALLVVLLLAACAEEGFPDLSAVERAESENGFVRLGRFGRVAWPAKVVAEQTGRDAIEFTAPSGAAQRYEGFEGYALKVLRLKGQGDGEMVLVFRSREKG